MERLSTLKPAQTLLLTNKTATLQELLKITCMDLVFKNVVVLAEIDKQVTSGQQPRKLTFVKAGEHFQTYGQAKYEAVLLAPFKENRNLEILFNTFMSRSYEMAGSEKRFKRLIFESDRLSSYYTQNLMEQVIGGHSLTEAGEQFCKEVQGEINKVRTKLSQHSSGQKDQVKELTEKIGGNIVLVMPEAAVNTYLDYSLKQELNSTTANGSDLLMWMALSEWSDDFVPSSGSGTGVDDFDAD